MNDNSVNSPTDIIEFHRRLIDTMVQHDEVSSAFTGELGLVGITILEPDIRLRLIIDGTNTRLEEIESDNDDTIDPNISMKWKTALRFWLGELDIMAALLTSRIKLQGQNLEPLFKLKSVVPYAREASKQLIAEFGWE